MPVKCFALPQAIHNSPTNPPSYRTCRHWETKTFCNTWPAQRNRIHSDKTWIRTHRSKHGYVHIWCSRGNEEMIWSNNESTVIPCPGPSLALFSGMFLGCGITQGFETGKIQRDQSKYIREMIAKYDMTDAVTSPLPMPAGTKPYMPQEDETDIFRNWARSWVDQQQRTWVCVERSCNICMGLMTMFSHTDQLDVMDSNTKIACSHLSFSYSDWTCVIDTRRSHRCHTLMLAGGATSWRSRSTNLGLWVFSPYCWGRWIRRLVWWGNTD